MENRPRTRWQNEQALLRRYTEWKKERESDSGGKRSSDSLKFGSIETSSENINVPLGLNTNKIGGKGKRVNRGINDDAKYNNVQTCCENESVEIVLSENNEDSMEFDNVVAPSYKRKLRSGLMGCRSKKIEINKGKSSDFLATYKLRKSRKLNEWIKNKQKVCRIREEEEKNVENPKKRKGFSKKEKVNKTIAKMSDDIDETDDDDVQIIDFSYGSTVNSVCSSSVLEKDDLASPSKKRGFSNNDENHMGNTNKGKNIIEYVTITDSSDESRGSEKISSSNSAYSSDSPYGEEAESCGRDEMVSTDNDKNNNIENSVVVNQKNCVGEEEEANRREKESRTKKKNVEKYSNEKLEREVMKETASVAGRLLRRRCSVSTNITELKIDENNVMGTPSCPFTLSDEEMDCIYEEDNGKDFFKENEKNNGDKKETAYREVSDKGKDVYKNTEVDTKSYKKRGRPPKNKQSASISANKILVDSIWDDGVYKDIETEIKGYKKRGRPPKNMHNTPIPVNKILVDSIWEKGDVQLEKLVSPEKNLPDSVKTLLLKFSFDDSDIELSDTSDVEADKLFDEMGYSMGLLNVGDSDSVTVDPKENIPSNTKKDTDYDCIDGGDHHVVLDEQVGLRCTVCHLVMKEIGNIIPDFYKHQGGRYEARDCNKVDYYNFDEGPIEDFTATHFHNFNHILQAEGTVWDLVPGIRNGMYPHQQEGFEFIWENIAGSIFVENAKKSISDGGGSGCIISHAPGTGKTRLTIMFLQSYMQLNSDCRPLIIAPCSMLLTWEEEFRKWNVGIPFHNLNSPDYSGQESKKAVFLQKNDRRQGNDLDSTRLVKLFSWKSEKSVLGISYQLFEELASISVLIDRGKNKKVGKGKYKDNDTAGQIRKMLLLLPGLLVLDEGHIPRNRGSQIWKALSEVETERRIMLSGTPFQNNFDELLNTFCMVRPKFSDEIISQTPANGTEKRRRIKSAAKGKWASMTNNIGKDNDQKLIELKKMISEFVHVYKGNILKEKLPGLRDFLVVLSPTNLQKNLIEVVGNNNFFKKEHQRSLISVHPSLFSFNGLSEKENPLVNRAELERKKLDPNEGVKTKFLVELIRLSWALNERVLVFSQYIKPLKLVMKQLRKQFHWTVGEEILYIIGEHCDKERQLSINKLNNPESQARVLLASSRACSEGINLIGASRVVLLDVVWNPSITRQSTSRAYRLGQKKVVHVYHLIAGSWEWTKYAKQAGKDRISDLVFSQKDGTHKPNNSFSVADDKILQDMVQHESMSSIFVKILNQPKESDLIDTFG